MRKEILICDTCKFCGASHHYTINDFAIGKEIKVVCPETNRIDTVKFVHILF